MSKINVTQIKREVSFRLSDEEIASRARQMSLCDVAIESLNNSLEEFKNQICHQVALKEAERIALSRSIMNNNEVRVVDCQDAYDYNDKKVRSFYQGKFLFERNMTQEEISKEPKEEISDVL